MSDLIAFLAAALAAMIAVAVVRTRRRRLGASAGVVVGCLLLIGSLLGGLALLSEHDAPAPLSGAIGLLPPPPVLPHPGRGFAVAVATEANGCANPVTVKVVVAGTGEYWADYRAETKGLATGRFPFVLVLPGGVTGAVRTGLASVSTALTNPVAAEFGYGNQIRTDSTLLERDRTLITGVVTDWPTSLLPILVTFHANWLSGRGLSTCYLRLPALSGSQTATSVVAAVGGCAQIDAAYRGHPCVSTTAVGSTPYVGALLLSHGALIVTVRSGEVTPDLSVPPPLSLIYGDEAWTCSGQPDTVGRLPGRAGAAVPDVVAGRGGGAFSLGAITGTAGGTCRTIAVISENSATYLRDLVILLIGAAMGLGLTLVVQSLIDLFSTRGASDDGSGGPPAGPSGDPGDPATRSRPEHSQPQVTVTRAKDEESG